MKPKNWLVMSIVICIILISCLVVDAIFAGLLWVILSAFEVATSLSIALRAFLILLFLHLVCVFPFIASFDKGGKNSGT